MGRPAELRPIVVYRIEQHPLDVREAGPRFPWLGSDDNVEKVVEELIGAYDPEDTTLLIDKHPAGPAWREILQALTEGRVRMVITHLAPLSSAQRQQLIGLCAQSGARLITPGDAGRNHQRRAKTTRST